MQKKFKVINIDNEIMTLKADYAGSCNSCKVNSSCGIGVLTNYFKRNSFDAPLQKNVTVGDFVNFKISSKKLYYSAFMFYILPILVLFIASYIGLILFPANELWQIIFGIVGFVATILSYKIFFK